MVPFVASKRSPPSIIQFSADLTPLSTACSNKCKPGEPSVFSVSYSHSEHPSSLSSASSSSPLQSQLHLEAKQQTLSPCKRPRAPRPSPPLLSLPVDNGVAAISSERALRATLDRLIEANYSYRRRQGTLHPPRPASKSDTLVKQLSHISLVPSHPPPKANPTLPHVLLPIPPDVLDDEDDIIPVTSPLIVINPADRNSDQQVSLKPTGLVCLQGILMLIVVLLVAALSYTKQLNFW